VAATVYLDTSFLMLSAKFHIDVLSETARMLSSRTEFVVPLAVITELQGLARNRGASGRDARVAMKLIQGGNVKVISSKEIVDADEALIQASELANTVVATADAELRRKIRAAGKPVVFLREKAKLELEGIDAAYR